MKIALIVSTALLALPVAVGAQTAAPSADRPEFTHERPFAAARPNVSPRRIAHARKKHARIKAARLKNIRIKHARLKHKRIKHHRIKLARRKAATAR